MKQAILAMIIGAFLVVAITGIRSNIEIVPPRAEGSDHIINATGRTLIRIGDKYYYWGVAR